MKRFLLVLAIAAGLLASCSSGDQPSGEITTINIPEALKDVRDFKLSDLVKDVELLELERLDAFYIKQPLIPHVGEKYILVYDYDTGNILLFYRDGRFACEVGKIGKGPGEHGMRVMCDMDPMEEHVVITDMRGQHVMVFNNRGELEIQRDLSSYFQESIVQNIDWDLDEGISISPNRPFKSVEGYASVMLFDQELNLVKKILPRKNNDSLDLYNIGYHESFSDGKESYYWECFYDTIYAYDASGKAEPRFRLELGDNKLPFSIMKGNNYQEVYQYDQPMNINWLGDYLFMTILVGGDQYPSRCDVFYDTKKKEGFTVAHRDICMKGQVTADNKSRNIQNDLFGIEPASLHYCYPKEKLSVQPIPIDLTASFYDLNCISNKEVKYPEIRDRLIQAIQEPQEEDGSFLVLMHLK